MYNILVRDHDGSLSFQIPDHLCMGFIELCMLNEFTAFVISHFNETEKSHD